MMRGLHLAALSLTAGWVLIGALAGGHKPRHRTRIVRLGLVIAIVSGIAWLVCQGRMAAILPFPQAQWVVLTSTGFGHVMVARIVLLTLAIFLPRARLIPIVAAIGLQPFLGHGATLDWAAAMSGGLHTIAATLWAGSVVALLVLAFTAPSIALMSAKRFSPVGVALLVALGGGIYGQWELIGGLPGLFGTTYGQLLLLKATILLSMMVCAALNGMWFAPDRHIRALRSSLGLEAALGISVVLVAALMATQMPGAHAQVIWPFAYRPVTGLWDDTFLRCRLLRILLPLAVAIGCGILALLALRVSRTVSLLFVILALVSAWRIPMMPLAPFLTPAVTTTFQTSETGRTAVTLMAGKHLFEVHCADCHNTTAKGKGPLATGDPVWPPDLTSGYFTKTTDGDWFWRIRHGLQTRDGRTSMPGNATLADAEIWRLVDYLRVNAGAQSAGGDGRWSIPIAAPSIRMRCSPPIDISRPGEAIFLGPHIASAPIRQIDPDACGNLSSDERAAIAVLSGHATAPKWVLIDPLGHIRQTWSTAPDKNDLALAAEWTKNNPAFISRQHH